MSWKADLDEKQTEQFQDAREALCKTIDKMTRDVDNVAKTVDEQADHFSAKLVNTEQKIKTLESSMAESLCRANERTDSVTEDLDKLKENFQQRIGKDQLEYIIKPKT